MQEEWHFAQALEAISDALPVEIALVNADVRRTWRELDQRAASLATALVSAGLKPDAKIGLYGYNSNEYVEGHHAIFKMRGVAVNVNYRYTVDELVYLLNYADAEAVIFDAQFAPLVEEVRRELPGLKLLIEIDDGSGQHADGAIAFEAAIASHSPLPRAVYSPDDAYMLFTGGTTGMPKGVIYRHGDFARLQLMGYGIQGRTPPSNIAEIVAGALANRGAASAPIGLAACPLMHGVGLWSGVFMSLMLGGCAVTFRNNRFDADALWRLVEREKVTSVSIVGDAFARPMLAALRAAQDAGRPYNLSSLKLIFSSGAMFSREVKEGLLEFADATLFDSMGASEGGIGSSAVSRANPPRATALFEKKDTTRVFDEHDREVAPGSETIGMVANGGFVPTGYYKDPVKSAATFRVINGQRYSFPGDLAKVNADGSIVLLGRGSACINTGGEKVFPEEVEEALKLHPQIEDALVAGVPDERFGERVVAIVASCADGALDIDDLLAFTRTKVAGYKIPRRVIVVDEVKRAANGKGDYNWAKGLARQEETAR